MKEDNRAGIKLWRIWLAIEVNILLWITVLGNGIAASGSEASEICPKTMEVDGRLILVGVLCSVIMPHWAVLASKKSR